MSCRRGASGAKLFHHRHEAGGVSAARTSAAFRLRAHHRHEAEGVVGRTSELILRLVLKLASRFPSVPQLPTTNVGANRIARRRSMGLPTRSLPVPANEPDIPTSQLLLAGIVMPLGF